VQAGPGLRTCYTAARQTAATLDVLLPAAAPTRSRLRLLTTGAKRKATALAAAADLAGLLDRAHREGTAEDCTQAVTDLLRRPASTDEAWLEFASRAAEFYT